MFRSTITDWHQACCRKRPLRASQAPMSSPAPIAISSTRIKSATSGAAVRRNPSFKKALPGRRRPFDASSQSPPYDFPLSRYCQSRGTQCIPERTRVLSTTSDHCTSAFIPGHAKPDSSQRDGPQQGFQWVDWRKSKLEFCVVSDVDPTGLKQLHWLMDSSAS